MPTNSANSETDQKITLAEKILDPTNTDMQSFSSLKALAGELKEKGRDDLARGIDSLADKTKAADEQKAVKILSGEEASAEEMLRLAKKLAEYKQFGYARRLLERARAKSNRSDNPDIYPALYQKHAVFTYKDPDLPVAWRLDRALNILKKYEDLSTTGDQETLGIAGAIYKRKWEVDGQRRNLERSLLYYLKGYAQGAPEDGRRDILGYLEKNSAGVLNAEKDLGYTGINAAFILDLLAQQEEEEANKAKLPSETSNRRRVDAQRIRGEIISSVPPLANQSKLAWLKNEWWWYATIGEAYFGLGDYQSAKEWLVIKPKGAGLLVPEWEFESTAQQLTRLALLKHDPNISEEKFEETETGKALKAFLQNDGKKVRSAFRGKFGLALSGGGFRASLYHIGVLARLAELDVLRHVEVLSCVSGGSIIGAYYYLELRQLLQTRLDDDIRTKDYVDIVKRIEEEFLKGVQRNIRTRVLAEFTTNLKMVFWPGYSRTRRVGELYERELYSRIEDRLTFKESNWLTALVKKFVQKRKPRPLRDLCIYPLIAQTKQDNDFRPTHHNWRRTNKVPILILNATSLNTGHVWQFTASFMGEPPDPTNSRIDSNYRLRRMYYRDAPRRHEQLRLGHAVAASSCVPGLFDPLTLNALYPDQTGSLKESVSVQLIDGGVFDNQGIAGLLQQDCTFLLVSDASGQIDSQNIPSRNPLLVLWRSNNISMARVRGIQYNNAVARKESSLVRGLMFVHLKQELTGKAIAWRDCPDDQKVSPFEETIETQTNRTSYGVARDIQQQLAAIRTDLDSFSDAEAYALMASGYLMTKRQFEGNDGAIDGFAEQSLGEWKFSGIKSSLSQGERQKHLEKLLRASSSLFFKVWNQSIPLKILKWTALVAALILVVWGFWKWRNESIIGSNGEWIRDQLNNLTFGKIGIAMIVTIGLMVARMAISTLVGNLPASYIMQAVRWRETLKTIAIGIVMCVLGWLLARVHLHVVDKIFLHHGKLKRFPKE